MQFGDEGIYWQVNFERFHLHFRDQAIISAVASKLDQVTTASAPYIKNAQVTPTLSSKMCCEIILGYGLMCLGLNVLDFHI